MSDIHSEERIFTPLDETYTCKQTKVTLPKYLGSKEVYIDVEIVDIMKKLWEDEVPTLGCCSGHDLTAPSIVVELRDKKSIAKLRLKLFEISGQWWDILRWELVGK